jgi:hypothetical protein
MGERRLKRMATDKKLPPSRALAAELIHDALSILRDNGKEMAMRDLMAKVEKQVPLDAWAKERYERTGYARWESILHFFSIDCVKAGYLIKKKGVWYLTPEGEEALKLSPEKLLEGAQKAYRKWRAEQPERPEAEGVEEGAEQAVAWVLAHSAVTAPLVGASQPEQLKASIAAVELKLGPKLKACLDDLTHDYRMGDAARCARVPWIHCLVCANPVAPAPRK